MFSVSFSYDGRHIVSGSDDWTICVWDVETCEQLREPLTGHQGTIYSVSFSPDGRKVVSGAGDKTVRVWDIADGTSVTFEGHARTVFSVTFFPDGRRTFLSGSANSTIRLWHSKDFCDESKMRTFGPNPTLALRNYPCDSAGAPQP